MEEVGFPKPTDISANIPIDSCGKLQDDPIATPVETKHEPTDNVSENSKESTSALAPIDPKDVTILPPPEYRCPGRGRWTNQLKYLLVTVIKPILNLKCSRYFKTPVDPITLRVPNYYDIITNPMDLGSIKKRLENNYYINAQECIDDVNLILRNCYTFNKPDHCVYLEGRSLEEQFKKKIGKMPFDEIEIPFNSKSQTVGSPKKKYVPITPSRLPVVHSTSSEPSAVDSVKVEPPVLVESTQPDCPPTSSCDVLKEEQPSPPPLEDARTPQVECDQEDNDDEPLAPPPLTPAPPVSEDNISPADLSSQTVTQSGLPILECAINRPQLSPDDSVSSAVDDTTVHSTQEDDRLRFGNASSNATNPLNISIDETKEDDCSASDTSAPFDGQENGELHTIVTSSVRPFAVQPSKTKKGVKRKADTTTPHTPSFNKTNSASSFYADDSNSARTSTRKIKPPNKELPGEDEPFGKAMKKSPLNNQLRFCEKLIKELLGKSHAEYAWPFYQPAYEKWHLPDYLEKIKKPMDLGTVKKKLEAREYKSVNEFAEDMRLIFHNCYQYNPSDNPIHQMAQKLHSMFENKFARLPSKASPSSSELSSSTSTSSERSLNGISIHNRASHSHPSGYGKSYQANFVASKVAAAKQASPNKYKKANGDIRSAHDGRKSAKYFKSQTVTSAKSTEPSPQSKNVSPQLAVVNPPPEIPDAGTIAALQKQLQMVMQQLTQMQQGGFQHDDKARDASSIQSQIDNLNQKKPRAPKRPRKSKVIADAVDSSSKSGSVVSSAVTSSHSMANSASIAESVATTVSMVASSKHDRHEYGAMESKISPTSVSSNIKTEQPPLSSHNSQPSDLPNRASVITTTAATNSKSLKTEPSRTISPPVSRTIDSSPHDLGPGQLPLTNGPVTSAAVSMNTSSSSSMPGPNSYWSNSVSKTNANSDTQSSNASTSAAPTSAKPGRKSTKNSNDSRHSPPAKKSNLKKVTKMPRPSDFVLDSDEEDNATDMTYEEKRQLSSNIDRLTKPQLYRVVHILRAHEPQLQDADVAEITLDLETVRAVTLRALEKFVNQCLKSKKPRGAAASAKKQAQAPPPPVASDTLPLEEYESRKEELVRKIEELGGKKVAKSYEKDLSEGINLDPVNHGVRNLSDNSSSDDSGDSSSDSDGSSDSDDSNSDDESPQKGGSKSAAAANSQNSAGAKRRQSPKGSSSHPNSGGVNGERKISASQSAFSNFAQGIKTTESSSFSSALGASGGIASSAFKSKTGSNDASGTANGSNSVSANVNKVLSTWNSALSTTTSVTSSTASSVNSMFQQFQKQARERSQFEQQLKNKAQSEHASNRVKTSNAPNLSESEDEMEDVGGMGSFGTTHGHVVDLNEQMNLINSFESSTTS